MSERRIPKASELSPEERKRRHKIQQQAGRVLALLRRASHAGHDAEDVVEACAWLHELQEENDYLPDSRA